MAQYYGPKTAIGYNFYPNTTQKSFMSSNQKIVFLTETEGIYNHYKWKDLVINENIL